MWKLFIWPFIYLVIFGYGYGEERYMLNHIDQCDMLGCAFANLGYMFLTYILFGAVSLYVLSIAGLFFYARIRHHPVNYWIPVFIGPFLPFVFAAVSLFVRW